MARDRDRLGRAASRLVEYARAVSPGPDGSLAPPPLTLAEPALLLEVDYRACLRALRALTRGGRLRLDATDGARYRISVPAGEA